MNFFGLFKTRAVSVQSPSEAAADVFEQLLPIGIEDVYSSDMSLVVLAVPFPVIGKYISELKTLTSFMEEDKEIPLFMGECILTERHIWQFFTSANGAYIDYAEVYREFLKVARDFLSTYNKHILIAEKSFNTERNLRIVTKFVDNLIYLSQELRTLSNEP